MRAWLVAFVTTLTLTTVGASAADQPAENWATARARSLTEQGIASRNAGATDRAVARFNEAISIDATFGPAYLALASLREGAGERDEALKVLDMALERTPGFAEAITARAEILVRAKRFDEATSMYLELLEAHVDDVGILKKLLDVAPRAGLFPVALAAARRLTIVARESGDDATEKEARLIARALEKLIAEADPVQRGRQARDPVRRALARASGR